MVRAEHQEAPEASSRRQLLAGVALAAVAAGSGAVQTPAAQASKRAACTALRASAH